MIEIVPVSIDMARRFIDSYHPMRTKGSLKGATDILMGFENGFPSFIAVFTTPRSRWKNHQVTLELSRLAWSPMAIHSAATFLRKCTRILKRSHTGIIVTYALPGTDGVVYQRSGFKLNGNSSGTSWKKRGKGERLTPETIGTGRKLPRYFKRLK